jgi:hypothetical protein
MKVPTVTASVLVLVSCVYPGHSWLKTPTKQVSTVGAKPIVAIVHRAKGSLSITVHPDTVPAKDPLRVFNALHDKFGSDYPIVAVVDDSAKISDLYEVSGTAGKAGFENVRTFISHFDNGKMFEVKFGLGMPFSINGPFDAEFDNSPK